MSISFTHVGLIFTCLRARSFVSKYSLQSNITFVVNCCVLCAFLSPYFVWYCWPGYSFRTIVVDRNRVNFENILVDRDNVAAFPVLTPEELTLFAVGTYQIKLAPSYYSEHIRATETFIIQNYNGPLNDLSDFSMPSNNVQLIRALIKSRHTSSKVYRCYVLIDENNQGLDSIRHYCCSCFTGRRTIGSCAHVVCLVWFLGWARHQDAVRRPALFLDSLIIDNDEDDDWLF